MSWQSSSCLPIPVRVGLNTMSSCEDIQFSTWHCCSMDISCLPIPAWPWLDTGTCVEDIHCTSPWFNFEHIHLPAWILLLHGYHLPPNTWKRWTGYSEQLWGCVSFPRWRRRRDYPSCPSLILQLAPEYVPNHSITQLTYPGYTLTGFSWDFTGVKNRIFQ